VKQSEIFLNSEGDGFYRRNQRDLVEAGTRAQDDQIIRCLRTLPVKPKRILEIGCSNGWRLELMRREFGAECFGIDPSAAAVSEGGATYPGVSLSTGTAERLPYESDSFELVIFGFCLYLCDRQDLFTIAAEADRVLADGGFLMILDFYPPLPYRNGYKHFGGLYCYKMDYAAMFLWNPTYCLTSRQVFADRASDWKDPDERLSVVALRKDPTRAYVDNPYLTRNEP
jgi:ubiquinone/menaquinone biosynthesis C-methylase UbiE